MKRRKVHRQDLRQESKIDDVFALFMDHVVGRLVAKGLDDSVALDAVFEAADYLTEKDVLPPFPDEHASAEVRGIWLVRAAEFGFPDFVESAAIE